MINHVTLFYRCYWKMGIRIYLDTTILSVNILSQPRFARRSWLGLGPHSDERCMYFSRSTGVNVTESRRFINQSVMYILLLSGSSSELLPKAGGHICYLLLAPVLNPPPCGDR